MNSLKQKKLTERSKKHINNGKFCINFCVKNFAKSHDETFSERQQYEKHKVDGSLEKIVKYWMEDKNTELPDIPKSENTNQTLIVGTSGTIYEQPPKYDLATYFRGINLRIIN